MAGFHLLDWIVIIGIGLIIFGPKAMQSMARSAGRGVSKAKETKSKALAELPMEELAKVREVVGKVPTSPQHAVQMLIAQPERPAEKAAQEEPPRKS